MIANNENKGDIKLLNVDNLNNNYDTIKTVYNGKISIKELTNNSNNNNNNNNNNSNNNNNDLEITELSQSKNLLSQKLDSQPIQVLSREKRQALYGIDCISDVVFSKWYLFNFLLFIKMIL